MSVFRRRRVFRDGTEIRRTGGGSVVTGIVSAAVIVFAGTASGNTTATSGGDASGSIVFAGDQITSISIEVSGSGDVVFAGSASGVQRNFGSASGAAVFGGTARPEALATGTITFAGSATVGLVFTMDGSGAIVFAGTAAPQHGAAASGGIVFAGTLGTPDVTGGTVTSAAAGEITVAGTATGTFGSTNNVPDAFFFAARFNVERSTLITSDTVTIMGNTQPASLSITSGSYSIDGGGYSTADTTINAGQTLTLQHTSAADYSSRVTTTIVIGGVTERFVSVTEREPPNRPHRRGRFGFGKHRRRH